MANLMRAGPCCDYMFGAVGAGWQITRKKKGPGFPGPSLLSRR